MDASHLLSPVRPPTELADERFAISADLSDATSDLPKPKLNGSSSQPPRSPQAVNDVHPNVVENIDGSLWLDQIVRDLKNLGYFDLFRTKFNC